MASPVTLQPATKDTYIRTDRGTTNYGSDQSIQAYQSGAVRGILSFDFSAEVPAGKQITSAILSLYYWQCLTGYTFTISRLLRGDWVSSEITYAIYKTGASWTTGGAKGDGTDYTSTGAVTAATVGSNNWVNATVTAQVQTALDSVSGIAHFIIDSNDASTRFYAYSSDYTVDTTKCPKLYIEYGDFPASALKTVNGLAKASVQGRNGLAIASIKTWNGLA
jgi:hypothetical protein